MPTWLLSTARRWDFSRSTKKRATTSSLLVGHHAVVEATRNYFKAQGLFGIPRKGEIAYSAEVELDLSQVEPAVAGPKRPQDRIVLGDLKSRFTDLFEKPVSENGYGHSVNELAARFDVANGSGHSSNVGHGDVLIAAITSCTNTSNPSVMLAAGLLAKKAVEKGLTKRSTVKASLAPGSRVVTDYLQKTNLQPYLDQLGFNLVGYGCTTCIGNSGPIDPGIESAVVQNDLVAASVLSGNRNFEARIHQNIKANFLMSPPLVVAFALAGRVNIDLTHEPIGKGRNGEDVYLKDIWPTMEEVAAAMSSSLDPDTFRRLYSNFAEQNPLWNEIPSSVGEVYEWNESSTYIQEPPFFKDFATWAERNHGCCRCEATGDSRRLGNDRSHQPGWFDQIDFTGRDLSSGARSRCRRLQ